jgi:hypothetical protein
VAVANTFHFASADGTPYGPIGTTRYYWAFQPDALEDRTSLHGTDRAAIALLV